MIKIAIPICIVATVLIFLVQSAVQESAKKVVTVNDLIHESQRDGFDGRNRVRLGARVSSDDIKVVSEPDRKVSFYIRDIEGSVDNSILVEYKGLMPDTLREGRDVILEGDFDGVTFHATTLNTQCPSKYEPPDPTKPVQNQPFREQSY